MLHKHIYRFSGLALLGRISALTRDRLLATILGASTVADAFFVAFKFPSTFRKFFAEGAIQSSLVPELTETLEHQGEKAMYRLMQSVFSYILVFLLSILVVFELFTPTIIGFLFAGFKKRPETLNMLICFSRITFPYLVFVSLSTVLSSVLNAYKKFDAEPVGNVVLQVAFIVSILFAWYFTDAALLISCGVIFAGLCQLVSIIWMLRKNDFHFRLCFDWTPQIKRIFKHIAQASLGSVVAQLNVFVDMAFAASLVQKSVSLLYYAEKIYYLPLELFARAFGVVLLPHFVSAKSQEEKNTMLYAGMQHVIAIIVPCVIVLFILSDAFVAVFYLGGKFKMDDALITLRIIQCYVFSLPAYILTKVMLSYFYAEKKMYTSFLSGCAAISFNIVGNTLLIPYFDIYGIATATTISSWLTVCVLASLNRKVMLPALASTLKPVVMCAGLPWLVYGIHYVMQLGVSASTIQNIIGILLTIALSIGYYCLVFKRMHIYDNNPICS